MLGVNRLNMKTDLLKWLEDWYQSNCDDDWEHGFGVTIESLDNPGWSLTADLGFDFDYPDNLDWNLIEFGEDCWVGYKIENYVFNCSTQGGTLALILFVFKMMIENKKIRKEEIQLFFKSTK